MRRLPTIARRARARKGRRYIAVSLVSVVIAHTTLVIGYAALGWSARVANVVAFTAGTLPAYTLNRRWTWGRTDRSRLLTEVAPYWGLSTASLIASTWAVGTAESVAQELSDSRTMQALMVLGAAVAVTGVLWVAKFAVFDRLLFSGSPVSARGLDDELSEHHQPLRCAPPRMAGRERHHPTTSPQGVGAEHPCVVRNDDALRYYPVRPLPPLSVDDVNPIAGS